MEGHLLLLLLLLLAYRASAVDPGQSEDGAYLILTQALTRHADRAAEADSYITLAASQQFFRGHGELSTEGVEHARKIGEAYRVYVESGHIDGRMLTKEVRFRGSDSNRVMMTAAAFSSGLFEDDGEPIVAPLFTVAAEDDETLEVDYKCELGWEDMKLKYGLSNTSGMAEQILYQMRLKEWNCTSPPAEQSDTVISEFTNSKTRKQLAKSEKLCALGPARQFMFNYIESLGGSGTNDTNASLRLKRTVGNLSISLMDNMDSMIHCYDYRPLTYCDPFNGKAIYWFTHDVNILAYMNVITFQKGGREFFQGRTPAFGVSLVLELWVKSNQYYLKAFVKNGVEEPFVEYNFCQYYPETPEYPRVGRYCTVQALHTALSHYIHRGEVLPCNPPPA